jgi:hypothetical protein
MEAMIMLALAALGVYVVSGFFFRGGLTSRELLVIVAALFLIFRLAA